MDKISDLKYDFIDSDYGRKPKCLHLRQTVEFMLRMKFRNNCATSGSSECLL